MKLYQKLILFVLAATAIPLVIGLAILKHNEDQLHKRLLAARQESAVRLAEVAGREFTEILERVQRALGYVDVEQMSPEELKGLMGIVYKQSEDIVQVALLDAAGSELVDGVYLDDPGRYPEYAGRLGVSGDEHASFLAHLPLDQARKAPPSSAVVGKPHGLGRSGLPGLSLVVPIDLSGGAGRWMAAVEMRLDRLARRIHEAGEPRGLQAVLVDSDGLPISRSRLDGSGPAVARLTAGRSRGSFLHGDALYAFARVEPLGWGVVLTQPEDEAWAEVRRSRTITLAWTGVSILTLLALGLIFTGRITRNLRRFAAGAEAFSRGDLDVRVQLRSSDELGLLARTFNRMGDELKASREEIEAWNRELADRVEQRTRELEVAHRRLLRTSKLAAIGQLGAGVAHEVNNPLVGILGNAQLLLSKNPGDEKTRTALTKIESAAKRCRDVIQNLLRFSEQEAEAEHMPCDLGKVIEEAFSLTRERITSQGIRVVWELADGLPSVLGAHRQLMQVFLNLLNNARTAMEEGGEGGVLTITSRLREDGLVEVQVRDTGRGIPKEYLERIFEPFFTTKDVWTSTGLGLSVAFRIVSDHGGRIEVESQPGEGSTFRVLLPVVEGET